MNKKNSAYQQDSVDMSSKEIILRIFSLIDFVIIGCHFSIFILLCIYFNIILLCIYFTSDYFAY